MSRYWRSTEEIDADIEKAKRLYPMVEGDMIDLLRALREAKA